MISATMTGRLGADPEQKFLPDGTGILELRIASNGRKEGETTWVRATLFGERGAKVAPYLGKGDRICVSGTLELRMFEHNGEKKSALEMRIAEIDLIQDRREPGEDRDEAPPPRQAAPPPRGPARPAPGPARPPPRGPARGQQPDVGKPPF